MRVRLHLTRLFASMLGGSLLPLLMAGVASACTNGNGFPH
jgi:hypothetical protein